MRDIGRRIQKYRLSRYDRGGGIRVPRWVWFALGAWLLWAGVVSDHSFFQLWRIRRASAREQEQLRTTHDELARLDRQANDPEQRRREAEQRLREDGWSRPNEIVFRIDGADTTHAAR